MNKKLNVQEHGRRRRISKIIIYSLFRSISVIVNKPYKKTKQYNEYAKLEVVDDVNIVVVWQQLIASAPLALPLLLVHHATFVIAGLSSRILAVLQFLALMLGHTLDGIVFIPFCLLYVVFVVDAFFHLK